MTRIDDLIGLPRPLKRLILMASDASLLALAVWLAFSIRLGEFYVPSSYPFLLLLMSVPFIGVAVFDRFGLYRMVTRFIGSGGSQRIVLAVSVTILCWGMIATLAGLPDVFPRSAYILVWLIANLAIVGSRQIVASLLNRSPIITALKAADKTGVLIYGAGSAGNQLAKELEAGGGHRIVGFIDDDPSLWGQKVGSVKVRRPEKIDDLVADNAVDEILLALPSATRKRRREVLQSLGRFPVRVKTVPSVGEIASGKVMVSDTRPISVDDLLGRDAVPPDTSLLAHDIAGRSVMITGAGGSIGSELVRQVMRQNPARLVLFELSEIALYDIEMELREAKQPTEGGGVEANGYGHADCDIVAVLGSVLDSALVRRTIKTHQVETIYHAAAYKHVPIVELNPVSGLANNTFGTLTMVEAARDLGVRRFVLISTDKAVRPTNVMGASKRLAELILQAEAGRPAARTVFTMVRFGNVLASSGSVVRRFTKQIESGGPVTVTHKDIIRYFMSIPEAAQLVIQAGAMANGGDVFVLDMGEQVKIDNLARMMIRLSGMTVDDGNGGDIEISYTGLRPGEKLFEELLIGANTVETEHRRIMRSHEPCLGYAALHENLAVLKAAMSRNDTDAIRELLSALVEGYAPAAALEEPASAAMRDAPGGRLIGLSLQ